jgi:TatD DNase family protein
VFYDVHVHQTSYTSAPDVCSIVSLYKNFTYAQHYKYASIGIHPWYATGNSEELNQLKNSLSLPNVIAIGEFGLDKLCNTPWQLQLSICQKQLELANLHSKPIIIHCVKAHSEMLTLIKNAAFAQPFVFHGFNRKTTILHQLLDTGAYISFGADLLRNKSTIESLAATPADKILFETDDSGITIDTIYTKAAEVRKTNIYDIILQVELNCKKVFGL